MVTNPPDFATITQLISFDIQYTAHAVGRPRLRVGARRMAKTLTVFIKDKSRVRIFSPLLHQDSGVVKLGTNMSVNITCSDLWVSAQSAFIHKNNAPTTGFLQIMIEIRSVFTTH